jgi:hypothetical protein
MRFFPVMISPGGPDNGFSKKDLWGLYPLPDRPPQTGSEIRKFIFPIIAHRMDMPDGQVCPSA